MGILTNGGQFSQGPSFHFDFQSDSQIKNHHVFTFVENWAKNYPLIFFENNNQFS